MTASIDSGRIEAITDECLRAALWTVQLSIGPRLDTRNQVVDSYRGGESDELEAVLRHYNARSPCEVRHPPLQGRVLQRCHLVAIP